MISFRPMQFDEQTIGAYQRLFQACFPGTDKYSAVYLHWLYRDNPDGHAVGFDAWDGDRLAAHYACIPAAAAIEGRPTRVLLSLNTATHPDYQGKGLFTKLAELSYEAGMQIGYDGVYGVANANSTPGFIRKLQFQLVRPLEARIGVGALGTGATSITPAFERLWSEQSLRWRCASPANPVNARCVGHQWQFRAAAMPPWICAYAEVVIAANIAPVAPVAIRGSKSPVRLFLGLLPDAAGGMSTYFPIPGRLRPSPLNLIYRSFKPGSGKLDASAIQFSFLDFDAY
jgi:GNAT superfamily N-acetyltransferase